MIILRYLTFFLLGTVLFCMGYDPFDGLEDTMIYILWGTIFGLTFQYIDSVSEKK